jgi:glycosyltransferase involved in cell wall biosynthesis
MRVLHVISTLAEGGPEHQLRLLLRRLPHDSEVVTLSPPGAVAATLRAAGISVHELGAGRGRLRRLIRRGRFDLVHTHQHRAGVPGRLAARLAGVPLIVTTEHHLDAYAVTQRHHLDAFAGRVYRAGERLGRVTIAASPAIGGRLRAWGVPETRIAVIPKAVDAGEFRFDPALRATARARLGLAPGVPVVGGVGRLEPHKRFDRLIRSLGSVPGAVLLLVGDGPARGALEQLAVIEGVADRVLFAGAVGHAREMLCAMDVFASPAEDTFGLVVLEAVAAGLPALYASCAPLEELAAARAAVPGSHRLNPHDRESLPRSLRVELLCFAERHGTRLPPRSAGRRYDADRQADEVGEVYERVASTPR